MSAFIKIACPASAKVNQPLFVRGNFHFINDDCGLLVTGAQVLKHIILVITRGDQHLTVAPFKHVVAFPDDISITEKGCSGFFNFDLFEKTNFDGAGDFYILCSLGTLRSNIVVTHVRN